MCEKKLLARTWQTLADTHDNLETEAQEAGMIINAN
jgi:hypothetical protein